MLGYFGVKSILESQQEIQSESSSNFMIKSFAVSLGALALGVSLVGFIHLGVGFYIALFLVTFSSFLLGSLLAKKIPLRNYKMLKVCSGILFVGLGLKILIFHLLDHGI